MNNISTNNVLEAAKIYIKRGWNPTPVGYRDKAPILKDYPNLKCTAENISEFFQPNRSYNIGIVLGESSGKLVDIDLDCREAVLLAPKFLPKTDCVFGREGKKDSHYVYYVDRVSGTKKFNDPNIKGKGACIVEIRGKGVTVFPHSIHKDTGEEICFSRDGDPAQISIDDLRCAVEALAAAVLLVRYWNQEGIRQDIALALSGLLLKSGWSADKATEFIYDIASAAGDEEALKRTRTVKHTRERINSNQSVYGLKKLKELLPDRVARKVVELLHLNVQMTGTNNTNIDTDSVIDEMNEKHAVVNIDGKCRILHKPKHHEPYLLSEERDLKGLYRNKKVVDGKSCVGFADYWLQHPMRKEYRGIKFYPGQLQDERLYNPWQGLKYKPVQGDCSLYIQHIHDNIAQQDADVFSYIICWMASIVQNPHKKLETAIVLRGKEGTGKGIFANEFGKLFGIHYSYIAQAKHLLGHFNAQLANKVVVFADEAFYAGDKASEGILKSIISEKKMMVEMKFYDPRQINNYLNLIIASNNSWVVPAGMEARRFLVADVSDKHMQDKKYFRAIIEQMQDGGREALVDYLLKVDIADFDHRNVPQTKALLENKLHSMSVIQKYWYEALRQGKILKSDDDWSVEVDINSLSDEVVEFAQSIGVKNRTSKAQLGTELNKLCPDIERDRRSNGKREYYYRVPSLEVSRKAFEEQIKMDIDWEDCCDDSDCIGDDFLCSDDILESNTGVFGVEEVDSAVGFN